MSLGRKSEVVKPMTRRILFFVHVLKAGPVPLVHGDDGVIRVEGTRVPLDTIAAAFADGATPEEIAPMGYWRMYRYPSVSLTAAYAVIAWVLQHQDEVSSSLAQRGEVEARVRAENERRFPQDGIRARLLSRRRS
jgi:uncharacterized protein (DUF433 family)